MLAADSAWNSGNLERAEALYTERITTDSTDVRALHRLALIYGWSERYEPSLALFGRLLSTDPENTAAAVDRARVLAWSGRLGTAARALDQVLARDPESIPALEAQALFASWADDYDRALDLYQSLLDMDPANLEALRGRARTLSWRGDLRAGETAWHRALELHPADIPSMVGLAQVLRWQGRDAEALEVSREALALDPSSADARTQAAWAEAALAPRVRPRVAYESDSDGNRIATTELIAAWRPSPSTWLRASGYVRRVEQAAGVGLTRDTQGFLASLTKSFGNGWNITAGGGVSFADATEEAIGAVRLALASPGEGPAAGELVYHRGALDYTALMVENGVRIEEITASARLSPRSGWNLRGAIGWGTLTGTDMNRRMSGRLSSEWRISPAWALGLGVTAFGYEKNLREGYFDPEFYGRAEAVIGWTREQGRWTTSLEGAPGVQQVGSDGELSGAARIAGSVAYRIRPGRVVGLSAGYSTTGVHEFTTGSADYRYHYVSLYTGWAF